MNKTLLLAAGLCAAAVLTSCKSRESAYKQAYDAAKAAEAAQTNTGSTVVEITDTPQEVKITPVQTEQPTVVSTPITTTPEVDDTPTRTLGGDVVSVSGNALKTFSVVVGSFTSKANAQSLTQRLQGQGYDARLVETNEVIKGITPWYRVVASSFNDKASAAQSRRELQSQFKDAWLLYTK